MSNPTGVLVITGQVGGVTRRVRLQQDVAWSDMEAAVRSLFHLDANTPLNVEYKDEAGEMCCLIEQTKNDAVTIARTSSAQPPVLQLFLSPPQQQQPTNLPPPSASAPTPLPSTSTPAAPAPPASSSIKLLSDDYQMVKFRIDIPMERGGTHRAKLVYYMKKHKLKVRPFEQPKRELIVEDSLGAMVFKEVRSGSMVNVKVSAAGRRKDVRAFFEQLSQTEAFAIPDNTFELGDSQLLVEFNDSSKYVTPTYTAGPWSLELEEGQERSAEMSQADELGMRLKDVASSVAPSAAGSILSGVARAASAFSA